MTLNFIEALKHQYIAPNTKIHLEFLIFKDFENPYKNTNKEKHGSMLEFIALFILLRATQPK